MIRLGRALTGHTASVSTYSFILALAACGDGSDSPKTAAPSLQQTPSQPANPGGAGTTTPMDPAAPGTTSPGGMGNPTTNEGPPGDVSLAPPSNTDPGTGTGAPAMDPMTEPTTEPPPVVADGECPAGELPTFEQLTRLETLPDPFTFLNGERMTSRSQWRCRREEIRKLAERFIYGENPAKPASVSGSVSNTAISVNVQNRGQSVTFNATVAMPAGANGPVPAIIAYAGTQFQASILAEGVAVISYSVDPVGGQFDRNPKTGAFFAANPDNQATGNLIAWAWGVSRIIDVIEQSGAQLIDPQNIGVHGCSFAGKGAFIAGAFEERIKLTVPYESGMSGVPAYRMIAPEQGAEVLRNAYEWQPWAGDAYRQFLVLNATTEQDTAGRARDQAESGELMYRLPVDTHEVLGMVAPRGLLVLGNPTIANLAPNAERVTTLAGAEIFSALGVRENFSYMSRTNNGTHCAFRQEYVPLLQQNIRKFLKGDASATTGTFDPDPRLTGQLAPNIAWETPTLSE
jgi:hypothetical protein